MTTEFFFKGKKSAADFNVWIVHFYSAHKFLAPGALIEVAAAICKRRPYKNKRPKYYNRCRIRPKNIKYILHSSNEKRL
jgi:hypothetical protein